MSLSTPQTPSPTLGDERIYTLRSPFGKNIAIRGWNAQMPDESPFKEFDEERGRDGELYTIEPSSGEEPRSIRFRKEDSSEDAKTLMMQAYRQFYLLHQRGHHYGYYPQSQEDSASYAEAWLGGGFGLEQDFEFGKDPEILTRSAEIVERVNRAGIVLKGLEVSSAKCLWMFLRRGYVEQLQQKRFWPPALQNPYYYDDDSGNFYPPLYKKSETTPLNFRPNDDLKTINDLIVEAYGQVYLSERGGETRSGVGLKTEIPGKNPINYVKSNINELLRLMGLTKLHG